MIILLRSGKPIQRWPSGQYVDTDNVHAIVRDASGNYEGGWELDKLDDPTFEFVNPVSGIVFEIDNKRLAVFASHRAFHIIY